MNRQMKIILMLLGPPTLVAAIGVGIYWWDRGAPPGFEPKLFDVAVEEVNRNHRGVRIEGMARYDVRISQPNQDETHYLYPLMPLDNFNEKRIRIMVRSTIKPERLVDMERLVIEGIARPPGLLITQGVIDAWHEEGYKFDKKFVLVESFDRHNNDDDE